MESPHHIPPGLLCSGGEREGRKGGKGEKVRGKYSEQREVKKMGMGQGS